ncbi:MAG: UvrD-helicase domain-containing protein, partial [Candidatus Marinimicrobia bacterium]|nr:UvrD-helicase domain-containing protein [Candidatus Neomarinimicrobiota bacterium]
MELDSQQKKAVENPTTPMAISAGAGSGKTRVLVERYVKVIIDGLAETEEVLTITFTKKAAAELKLRIRERLNE